ncbi:MAG: hypothetical protein IJ141_08330 [Lachnospiraceae bacterium]|nr:hypothetical protein [Lachnospiraceae bacterium]
MCKVVITDLSSNLGFVIYNHLFSHEKYDFTIHELISEIQEQYNLSIPYEFVNSQINGMVSSGLINQNIANYTVNTMAISG